MEWLRKLFGWSKTTEAAPVAERAPDHREERPSVPWLAADDPGNPFGVAILNLMGNLQYTAASKDVDIAARAGSWRAGQQDRLGPISGQTIEVTCDLRFPAASELPDGMLFCPERMEDKWVIAWRDGEIRVARSWSGETWAMASATLGAGSLQVSRIRYDPASPIHALGDAVRLFDWILRVHALGQRIPLVVSEEGARTLAETPLIGFSFFGHRLFAAARAYDAPEPALVLCSDGAVVAAIQDQNAEALDRLLAAGASATAPCTLGGYRPVHLAMLTKNPELLHVLLRHGARADQRGLRGTTPLLAGISVNADLAHLELLLGHGADVEAADDLGFRPLHEAAQRDQPETVRWLLDHGATLEARTQRGLTPLHIACGLGSLAAVRALQAAGADLSAESPMGTPLAIADAQRQAEMGAWLRTVGATPVGARH